MLVIAVLAASTGCQTYPIRSPVTAENLAKVTASAPTLASSDDISLCAATTLHHPRAPADEAEQSTNASHPHTEVIPTSVPAPTGIKAGAGHDGASTLVPPQRKLTLTDLERLALVNNPTLPEAGALLQQQQGLTRQFGLYPNPTAGYVRTDADKSGESQTDGVFLSQTIITGGKLRLARQAGRADIQMRQWQLTAQQMRVLNDLRIRYFEVLGAQRAIDAAKEQLRLAEDGRQAAEQLLQAKQGSRPDVLQAGMELGLVRTALREADSRYQSAWWQLANAVGVLDLPPTPLVDQLEDGISVLDEKKCLQRLLEASPLLKTQENDIRAAQYELQLAKAQAVPDVNVQVLAQRDHIMKYSNVTTLISIPMPLFNRNQGNIVNAQGVLRQAQTEYQRIRLALSDLLAVSFRNYRSFLARVEQLQKEVLPQAKENLDLTTQGYKAGRLDFLHVQNARRMYFQSNLEYIDALTELHKVVVEIEGLQLTGGLNPTEVGTALQTMPGAPTGTRGVLLQLLQTRRGGGSQNLPGAIQASEK